MKKTLIAAVVVMLSFIGTAQETIKTYALDIGYWNEYNQDWTWDARKPCNVIFYLQGPTIISNDNAKSTYYTFDSWSVDINEIYWSALDEKKRDCVVSMKNNISNNYFVVIYPDICFRYIW
jgi:hypothetical protein